MILILIRIISFNFLPVKSEKGVSCEISVEATTYFEVSCHTEKLIPKLPSTFAAPNMKQSQRS